MGVTCQSRDGDLIIVGGGATGRLKEMYNGVATATVCDDLFDDGVACRQLGFDG
ncbi:MAG: hypothetical protein ACJAZO_002509 [Myxococcota bacterium]|jgi:hypothetical protein